MSAQQQDILIEQGSTQTILWEIENKSLDVGYTFAAKLRPQHASASVILSITSFTAAKVGPHTHVTTIIPKATTEALSAPYMGVYDLESTKTSDGSVTREVEGSFYVTPEATR